MSTANKPKVEVSTKQIVIGIIVLALAVFLVCVLPNYLLKHGYTLAGNILIAVLVVGGIVGFIYLVIWAKKGSGAPATPRRSIDEVLGVRPTGSGSIEEMLEEMADARAALPWPWAESTAESSASMLFENLRSSLPAIFDAVDQPGRDPVFVLVDLGRDENRLWRGLLRLLFMSEVYYSPERLTGQSMYSEIVAGDVIYKAPAIGGKELKVGVYAVERNDLFTSLPSIAAVPKPMIGQVLSPCPPDMFTVAYFCNLSLGIKFVSRDAQTVAQVPV